MRNKITDHQCVLRLGTTLQPLQMDATYPFLFFFFLEYEKNSFWDFPLGCSTSDPSLLWLRWRLAAAAPIRPLAWKLPYAAGVALKRKKEKNLSKGHTVEKNAMTRIKPSRRN